MQNSLKLSVSKNQLTTAVALMVMITSLWSCQGNNTPAAKTQDKTDSLRKANDSLQSQVNAARVQVDEYMTKASQLEEQIKQKDAQIARITKEKEELQRRNTKLVSELKANKKLISSLRDELSDTTKSYADRLGLLENDKNDLIRQRDSLVAKYNHVLALGSVLHASNIRLTAIHLKRNGTKEKDTKRARRADLLRVDFDIDENRIAENGVKKLYLVIKDPKGELLSSPVAGSGVTTTSNGKPLNYTLLKEIPLVTNEPVKDITVEWRQEGDYEKGTYAIDIYNGGYKIGGGKVELK